VEDEKNFAWATSLIKHSFNKLMVKYLESHQYPAPTAKITMEQFDQAVTYEIDLVELLEEG
jgi:hypothetical protein